MQCLPFTQISDINVKSIGHSSTFSGNITLSYQADPLAFWRMRLSQCTQQICFLIRGLSGQHFKIWASRYTRRHLISSFVTNFVKIEAAFKRDIGFEKSPPLRKLPTAQPYPKTDFHRAYVNMVSKIYFYPFKYLIFVNVNFINDNLLNNFYLYPFWSKVADTVICFLHWNLLNLTGFSLACLP